MTLLEMLWHLVFFVFGIQWVNHSFTRQDQCCLVGMGPVLGRGRREHGRGSFCVYFRQLCQREFKGHLKMWSIESQHLIFFFFFNVQVFRLPFLCISFWDCFRQSIAATSISILDFVDWLGSQRLRVGSEILLFFCFFGRHPFYTSYVLWCNFVVSPFVNSFFIYV